MWEQCSSMFPVHLERNLFHLPSSCLVLFSYVISIANWASKISCLTLMLLLNHSQYLFSPYLIHRMQNEGKIPTVLQTFFSAKYKEMSTVSSQGLIEKFSINVDSIFVFRMSIIKCHLHLRNTSQWTFPIIYHSLAFPQNNIIRT